MLVRWRGHKTPETDWLRGHQPHLRYIGDYVRRWVLILSGQIHTAEKRQRACSEMPDITGWIRRRASGLIFCLPFLYFYLTSFSCLPLTFRPTPGCPGFRPRPRRTFHVCERPGPFGALLHKISSGSRQYSGLPSLKSRHMAHQPLSNDYQMKSPGSSLPLVPMWTPEYAWPLLALGIIRRRGRDG